MHLFIKWNSNIFIVKFFRNNTKWDAHFWNTWAGGNITPAISAKRTFPTRRKFSRTHFEVGFEIIKIYLNFLFKVQLGKLIFFALLWTLSRQRLSHAIWSLDNTLCAMFSAKIAIPNWDGESSIIHIIYWYSGCMNLRMSLNKVIKKVFKILKIKCPSFPQGHVILERKLLEEREETDPGLAERSRPLTRTSSSSSVSSSGISSVTLAWLEYMMDSSWHIWWYFWIVKNLTGNKSLNHLSCIINNQ